MKGAVVIASPVRLSLGAVGAMRKIYFEEICRRFLNEHCSTCNGDLIYLIINGAYPLSAMLAIEWSPNLY